MRCCQQDGVAFAHHYNPCPILNRLEAQTLVMEEEVYAI